MEFKHSFGLPSKLVWKWIKDDKVLRNSIVSCKSFAEISAGVYRAEVDIQLGPIKDLFILEIQRVKEKRPTFYRLKLNGKGNIGEIVGGADLFLSDLQGTAQLLIKADVELRGTIALAMEQFKGEKDRIVKKFLQRLESEMKKGIYFARNSK